MCMPWYVCAYSSVSYTTGVKCHQKICESMVSIYVCTHTHNTHTHTHTVKHTYTHMTECEHNGLQYTSTFRSGTVQNGTLSACSSFMPRLPKHSKVTQISNYNYRRMNTCSEAHTHLPNIQMHITRVPPRLVGLVS